MKLLALVIVYTLSSGAWASSYCIAHQGSFKKSPRNSLESFQEAIDLGADGVEFDIQHTQDGEAIVMHDPKLTTATHAPGKVCPLDKKINQLTLNEIRENCSLKYGEAYYSIPTLSEALELMGRTDKFVFIELKDAPTINTRMTIERYYGANPEKLRIIAFKVKHLDALVPFIKGAKGLDLDVAPWGTPQRYGVNVWNRTYTLRKGLKYKAREASVWTVNREKRLRKLIGMDIDFITTDEVELCLSL